MHLCWDIFNKNIASRLSQKEEEEHNTFSTFSQRHIFSILLLDNCDIALWLLALNFAVTSSSVLFNSKIVGSEIIINNNRNDRKK